MMFFLRNPKTTVTFLQFYYFTVLNNFLNRVSSMSSKILPDGSEELKRKSSIGEAVADIAMKTPFLTTVLLGKLKMRAARYKIENRQVQVAFDEFPDYIRFEFPDITEERLEAMCSVKTRSDRRNFHWDRRSYSRRAFKNIIFLTCTVQCYNCFYHTVLGDSMSSSNYAVVSCAYVFLATDLCANFFTSFLAENGRSETRYHRIALNYFKRGHFIIDLLACIPSWWYLDKARVENDFYIDWKTPDRMNPVTAGAAVQVTVIYIKFALEAYRVYRCSASSSYPLLQNIFFGPIVFFSLLVLLAIIFFWCCQYPHSKWYDEQVIGDNMIDSTHVKSLVYLHGTLQFLLGKGEPTTVPERIFAIVLNMVGLFFTALMVGTVTNVVQKFKAKETKWNLAISEINDSMRQMGLSEELQTRIRNYYAFSWALNGGDDSRQGWLASVSKSYHEEACIQVNETLISSVPIFRESKKNFVRAIIMKLQTELFLPGDYVIKFGDLGDSLYFVVKGVVQAMDEAEQQVYAVLSQGNFFGEIALLQAMPKRTATVRSFTYSQLNVLYKEDFDTLLLEYPEDAKLIAEEAKKRQRNSDNIEKNIYKTKTREKGAQGVASKISGSFRSALENLSSSRSVTEETVADVVSSSSPTERAPPGIRENSNETE